MGKIAVAMSLYNKDSVSFFKESVDSILGQSNENFEIFIQVDGKVRTDLESVLLNYNSNSKVHVFFHNENIGLAERLNNTINLVIDDFNFSYLARMDSDDISDVHRFHKQFLFMKSNPDIGVVGSDVIEINNIGESLFYKKMHSSHTELEKNIIKRCPFNHPSVFIDLRIFREKKIRYKSELKNTQDYYLWVDMLANGVKFANINEPLLKFRVDNNFHSRRGLKKALNDFKARCYAFKHLKVLNTSNIIHTILLFLLRISPKFIKKAAYQYLR